MEVKYIYQSLFVPNKLKIILNKKGRVLSIIIAKSVISSRNISMPQRQWKELEYQNQESKMALWKSLFNTILRHNDGWNYIPCFLSLRQRLINEKERKNLDKKLGNSQKSAPCEDRTRDLQISINSDYETDALPRYLSWE